MHPMRKNRWSTTVAMVSNWSPKVKFGKVTGLDVDKKTHNSLLKGEFLIDKNPSAEIKNRKPIDDKIAIMQKAMPSCAVFLLGFILPKVE
jgi:hypothetical protein